jgi:putative SOS response-associated peptidase YedK
LKQIIIRNISNKTSRKQVIPWLNDRSETLLESKMFGKAALSQRFLVPAPIFLNGVHFSLLV